MSAALGASVPWRPPVVVCARRQSPRARASRQGRQSFFFASDEKMGQRMARTIPGPADSRNSNLAPFGPCTPGAVHTRRPAPGIVYTAWARSSAAERGTFNPCVLGSNPSGLTKIHARTGRRTTVRGLSQALVRPAVPAAEPTHLPVDSSRIAVMRSAVLSAIARVKCP